MKTTAACLSILLLFGTFVSQTSAGTSGTKAGLASSPWADEDQALTKKVCAILTECEKIKPGTTRAQVLKAFTSEGGIAVGRTYVSRRCPIIKIDVWFTPSG